MSKYLIIGGKQKSTVTAEWSGYQSCIALIYDEASQQVTPLIDYRTPQQYRVAGDECSILFKAGQLNGNILTVCTQTEILQFNIHHPHAPLLRLSLPIFNDLHHVMVTSNNTFLVVSTGLDAVFELSFDGNLIQEWSTAETDIWARFDKKVDYRKVLTTKPHHSHPNYCFEYNGEYYVTRFQQKDALNLNSGETLNIEVGHPHDGYIVDDKVYFTTVNGFIVCFDLGRQQKQHCYNLNQQHSATTELGWCRSLLIEKNKKCLVGFTRIRGTKFAENITWLKQKLHVGYQGCEPTRIVKYDLQSNSIDWSLNLEPHNINAVFSVLKIDD